MDTHITLDQEETRVRDFLIGAAQHYGKSHDGKVPILRFAGGWVRDKLLKGESKDLDVAIDCMTGKEFYGYMQEYHAERLAQGLEDEELGRLAEIKKDADKSKHLETGHTKYIGLELDLVNLRTETYNEDSRNPEVQMGTAKEDALRRDATINALFYNLNTKEVEDYTEKGLADLRDGIIRTPLDPEQTFRDDPLRILRLIRFACRLGFSIESEARHWMKDESIQAALQKKISRERILTEVQKMLQGARPREAVETILDRGLYGTIFTIPDADNSTIPTPDTTLIPKALDVVSECLKSDSQSVLRSELLLTEKHQYWAWLLATLLPYIGQPLPSSLIQKGAPLTMGARIARDGLKIDNETGRVMSGADKHALTEVPDLCKAFSTTQTAPESPVKRKRDMYDRVMTGAAIRRWGEDWRIITLAALMSEVARSETAEAAATVKERYERWLKFIVAENLGNVWDRSNPTPIMEGKGIVAFVTKERGPFKDKTWVKECVTAVFEYQLREKDQASVEGAKEAILEAIDSGAIKSPSKK